MYSEKEKRSMREAALRAANRARKELGLAAATHLEKGRRQDPDRCPITKTILKDAPDSWEASTSTRSIELLKVGDETVQKMFFLTSLASEFVVAFDDGEFPYYDADKGA